jgi:hypothetical protein
MLPSENLNAIMAGLAAARRPIVIRASPFRGELPKIELIDWINTRFVPYRRIGEFMLMRRKAEPRPLPAEHDPGAVEPG